MKRLAMNANGNTITSSPENSTVRGYGSIYIYILEAETSLAIIISLLRKTMKFETRVEHKYIK